MKNKKIYEIPQMETIAFKDTDIVTASSDLEIDVNNQPGW